MRRLVSVLLLSTWLVATLVDAASRKGLGGWDLSAETIARIEREMDLEDEEYTNIGGLHSELKQEMLIVALRDETKNGADIHGRLIQEALRNNHIESLRFEMGEGRLILQMTADRVQEAAKFVAGLDHVVSVSIGGEEYTTVAQLNAATFSRDRQDKSRTPPHAQQTDEL